MRRTFNSTDAIRRAFQAKSEMISREKKLVGPTHVVNQKLCWPWLPDGYSQILRLYVLGPSGLKDYGSATLRGKICHLATLLLAGHRKKITGTARVTCSTALLPRRTRTRWSRLGSKLGATAGSCIRESSEGALTLNSASSGIFGRTLAVYVTV